MKLAVLFSGGKDSTYALYKAMQCEEVMCLISIISENSESYMFHTPNVDTTSLQAKAMGIPLIRKETKGEKEKELTDLKDAIREAIDIYGIEGVVTGAVESVYQATRVQRICNELGIWCFNPLWQKDQLMLLEEIIGSGFETVISGIFAYPMNKAWLGQNLNDDAMHKLKLLQEKYQVSPTGEGGELETTVLDAPFFCKRIVIDEDEKDFDGLSGVMKIKKAHLDNKKDMKKNNMKNMKLLSGKSESLFKGGNIFLVDTSYKKDSLYSDEFVLPVARALDYKCSVIHYSEITENDLEKFEKIIICGTSVKDEKYLDDIDKFSWLKKFDKPVLGICSGMHIIAKVFGIKLQKDKSETGMRNVKVRSENDLITKDIEAYCIHNYSVSDESVRKTVKESNGFRVLASSDECIHGIKHNSKPFYGVQFHPEVRNAAIIERFISLGL